MFDLSLLVLPPNGLLLEITGATGTVGSEVVKQLVSSSPDKNDIIIKAAIRSQNKAHNFKQYNKSVQIVIIDCNKPETLADALKQVDRLFRTLIVFAIDR